MVLNETWLKVACRSLQNCLSVGSKPLDSEFCGKRPVVTDWISQEANSETEMTSEKKEIGQRKKMSCRHSQRRPQLLWETEVLGCLCSGSSMWDEGAGTLYPHVGWFRMLAVLEGRRPQPLVLAIPTESQGGEPSASLQRVDLGSASPHGPGWGGIWFGLVFSQFHGRCLCPAKLRTRNVTCHWLWGQRK